jgi:Sigma-70, region 4
MWSQLAELADHVLAKMPEGERRALVLHEIEGKTFDEIAKIESISKGTAHARYARGVEKLRKAKEDGTLDTILVPVAPHDGDVRERVPPDGRAQPTHPAAFLARGAPPAPVQSRRVSFAPVPDEGTRFSIAILDERQPGPRAAPKDHPPAGSPSPSATSAASTASIGRLSKRSPLASTTIPSPSRRRRNTSV